MLVPNGRFNAHWGHLVVLSFNTVKCLQQGVLASASD